MDLVVALGLDLPVCDEESGVVCRAGGPGGLFVCEVEGDVVCADRADEDGDIEFALGVDERFCEMEEVGGVVGVCDAGVVCGLYRGGREGVPGEHGFGPDDEVGVGLCCFAGEIEHALEVFDALVEIPRDFVVLRDVCLDDCNTDELGVAVKAVR